jgi:type I restriction enzyme M protein
MSPAPSGWRIARRSAPLHAPAGVERDIHRLQYETALHPDAPDIRAALDAERRELATLREQLDPLRIEIDRLSRQFWVTKAQVKANHYDLSASRYRAVEQEEVFYEDPQVTIERIQTLERAIADRIGRIQEWLKK